MAAKYTKTIICLANSRKLSGHCVAGKEFVKGKIGGWIRPVSSLATGELSTADISFQNGQVPGLLDVIAIPMLEPRPHGYQSENHLNDHRSYWGKVGEVGWKELRSALDKVPGALWANTSSYYGLNDRLPEATATNLGSSLKLIEVKDLKIVVAVEGAEFGNGKRKVRGRFTFKDAQYWLSVTDPVVERAYLAGANGEFDVGHAILCISLGEPYGGYAYKLIAGVFLKG